MTIRDLGAKGGDCSRKGNEGISGFLIEFYFLTWVLATPVCSLCKNSLKPILMLCANCMAYFDIYIKRSIRRILYDYQKRDI